MGTGFSIDTPLKVARYGISSAVSLIDDVLIEQMREYICRQESEPFCAIDANCPDARAVRITAYLNLLKRLVERQLAGLKAEAFIEGSEITRYFRLLPDSPMRTAYLRMLAEADPARRLAMQDKLRRGIVAGKIDVNIMTKVDFPSYHNGTKQPPEFSLAKAALRGFALSDLDASVIFSAGLNPGLYEYAAEFRDFFPDRNGYLKKRIILKVSDFRSALVQGKFLAKRGLWVSEFRVESGLNCGGHAFGAGGMLIGPVLEEFKTRRDELRDELGRIYAKALESKGYENRTNATFRVTAQGGITTCQENHDLFDLYQIDGTGWGTPFLLVPEVTNVDATHLRRLIRATEEDVYLSQSSPLGIPFWNLRTSDSETTRRRRISCNSPGSPCPKGYGALNSEFTEIPVCTASRTYQRQKLKALKDENLSFSEYNEACKEVMIKSCICHDLAGGATLKYGIDHRAKPAICAGPTIVKFKRLASLEEMVGHIYGRNDLLEGASWPHMFVQELKLHITALRQDAGKLSRGILKTPAKHFAEARQNLFDQINYYLSLGSKKSGPGVDKQIVELTGMRRLLQRVPLPGPVRNYLGLNGDTAGQH